MTTLVDALTAIVIANWGGGGGGGVVPATIVAITDYRTLVPARDSVDNIYLELGPVRRNQINNNYCDVISNVLVTMTSATSDDRLKIIVDECRWICNNVAVTGVTSQSVTSERDMTDRTRKVWVYQITVQCIENLASSSSAYASGTATTFTADHLIASTDLLIDAGATVTGILDKDNMASDSAVKLATQQSIKAYVDARHTVQSAEIDSDITTHTGVGAAHHALTLAASCADVTVTTAQLEDLLMFGSGNATYVPCVLEGTEQAGKMTISGTSYMPTNVDATDFSLRYSLPIPTVKGALKLYVTGYKLVIYDADAGDYVTGIWIFGQIHTGSTQIMTDATDRTAHGTYTGAVAATDCSGYTNIIAWVGCIATDAADIDIASVQVLCYYAA